MGELLQTQMMVMITIWWPGYNSILIPCYGIFWVKCARRVVVVATVPGQWSQTHKTKVDMK